MALVFVEGDEGLRVCARLHHSATKLQRIMHLARLGKFLDVSSGYQAIAGHSFGCDAEAEYQGNIRTLI